MKHRSRARKTGLPPGTVMHIGKRKVEHAAISLTHFSPDSLQTEVVKTAAPAIASCEKPGVSWIDVAGLHDTALLEQLGRGFSIPPLVLEDIVNTDQRPKIEIRDEYVFVVAKTLRVAEGGEGGLDVEQVSFFFTGNVLLTFNEHSGEIYKPVRERLRVENSRLRKGGVDYLAYALLDLVVDHYFVVLDSLNDKIEALEDAVVGAPDPLVTRRIHCLKRTLLLMRKATWPLREMITAMVRGESPLIKQETHPFLRDIYDHAIHIMDTIEIYRDMVSGLLEVHLSNVNNRMGEVMKVLTIIATIFIPLTFVAGVYGMNFEHMPELHWRWSYPVVLFAMFGIAVGLLLYFRARRWI